MEHLREWRLNLAESRTLEAAGRLLGVSAAQLSRYENGTRNIPPERVLEVERITGVSRHILRPDVFGPPPSEAAE